MILKTKKVVEENNQIVFKTDLIPEDDVDKKILNQLTSNKIPAIDKMIEDLIAYEANDLRVNMHQLGDSTIKGVKERLLILFI